MQQWFFIKWPGWSCTAGECLQQQGAVSHHYPWRVYIRPLSAVKAAADCPGAYHTASDAVAPAANNYCHYAFAVSHWILMLTTTVAWPYLSLLMNGKISSATVVKWCYKDISPPAKHLMAPYNQKWLVHAWTCSHNWIHRNRHVCMYVSSHTWTREKDKIRFIYKVLQKQPGWFIIVFRCPRYF